MQLLVNFKTLFFNLHSEYDRINPEVMHILIHVLNMRNHLIYHVYMIEDYRGTILVSMIYRNIIFPLSYI